MTDRDGRDRRTLTLLVQLFGREILDRLAAAGFTDSMAIAGAGVERLARDGGIPIAVAQRVAAVVGEAVGTAAPTAPEAPADVEPPARAPRRRAAREAAQADGPATQEKAASPAEATPPAEPAPAVTELSVIEFIPPAQAAPPADAVSASEAASLDEIEPDDPFVDDVALVSWMGFSGQTPSGRMTFSVADAILDPPSRTTATGKRGDEAALPAEVAALAAEPQARPAIRIEQAPARRPTLSGSFWGFGARETIASPSPPPRDPSRREPHGH